MLPQFGGKLFQETSYYNVFEETSYYNMFQETSHQWLIV